MDLRLHWKGKAYRVKEEHLFDLGARMERHMTASEVLANLAGGRVPGVAFAAMFREAMAFLEVQDVPQIGDLMRAAYAEHAVTNAAAQKGWRVDEKSVPIITFVGSWAAAMFDGADAAIKSAGVGPEPEADTPKKKTPASRSKRSRSVAGSGG